MPEREFLPGHRPGERLIVALDLPDPAAALGLAAELAGLGVGFKVGMELFYSAGPEVVRRLAHKGHRVFVDLKCHDIPNTVAGAVRSIVRSGAWMLNLHAAGGRAMLEAGAAAAREEAASVGLPRPLVVAVTVLTSLSEAELQAEVGVEQPLVDQVVRWARLAQAAGLDGVVASPQEVARIKEATSPGFLGVTPGVRPRGVGRQDQQRVLTPAEALAQGADYLVIGRPITAAPDPRRAAEEILYEMKEAAGL